MDKLFNNFWFWVILLISNSIGFYTNFIAHSGPLFLQMLTLIALPISLYKVVELSGAFDDDEESTTTVTKKRSRPKKTPDKFATFEKKMKQTRKEKDTAPQQ